MSIPAIDPGQWFEVHELRRAMRSSPDARIKPQVVVGLTQTVVVEPAEDGGHRGLTFHGGSTLVVDLTVPEVKYRIVKRIGSRGRRERAEAYGRDVSGDGLRAWLYGR